MKSSAPISGSRPGHARHLDAQQDARRDQLRALAQPPDGVAPYLQMFARLDQRDVDGTRQLREVVADDLDGVAQGTQHRRGRVLLRLVALRVERDDDCS